ncbi:MAG TPA: hypothetical protein PKZ22_08265 [Accumulibacter sp.]|nr:hypothetical protein [Accumulibacter sp.]
MNSNDGDNVCHQLSGKKKIEPPNIFHDLSNALGDHGSKKPSFFSVFSRAGRARMRMPDWFWFWFNDLPGFLTALFLIIILLIYFFN